MKNSWYHQNITNKQEHYCLHSDVQIAKDRTYQYRYSPIASYNPYKFDENFTLATRQESWKRFSKATLEYIALGEEHNPAIGKSLQRNDLVNQTLSAEPTARERAALRIQERLDERVGPPQTYLGIRKHVLGNVNSFIDDNPDYLKWRQSPHEDLRFRATEWGKELANKLNEPVGAVSSKYLVARETGTLKTVSLPMYQGRLNEEDIYHLVRDVKQFQSHLQTDMGRGAIRNTNQNYDPETGVEIITAKQALLKLRELTDGSKTLQETKPLDRWEQIFEKRAKKSTEQVKAPMTYLQALLSEPVQQPAIPQVTAGQSLAKESKPTHSSPLLRSSQPETDIKTQVMLDWPRRQRSLSETQQSKPIQNVSSAQQANMTSDTQISPLEERNRTRQSRAQTLDL